MDRRKGIPSEFSLARYERLDKFNAAEWLGNLEVRARLLASPVCDGLVEAAWQLIQQPITAPYRINGAQCPPLYLGEGMPDDPSAWLGTRVTLTIDLLGPTDALKKQFAAWLRAARIERGIVPINQAFSARDFGRWQAMRVLPYLDLRIIEHASFRRFSFAQVGEALFPDDVDIDVAGRVRKAVRPLAEMLVQPACIEHLRSICEAE